MQILDLDTCKKFLPKRKSSSHKGSFGHVLVIAGDTGMGGAGIMTATAAARAGAGLVTLATHPTHSHDIWKTRPEIISYGIESPEEIKPLLEKTNCLAIGPGLTNSAWSKMIFKATINSELPMVIDAGALDLLIAPAPSQAILTPHPGEAARLLNCNPQDIQKDRIIAVKTLANNFKTVAILKGENTLIAAPGENVFLCPLGNPGMASAGMGDVLTGIIAGLLAQKLGPLKAAQLGVMLHANAGDLAIKKTSAESLLAMDLMAYL